MCNIKCVKNQFGYQLLTHFVLYIFSLSIQLSLVYQFYFNSLSLYKNMIFNCLEESISFLIDKTEITFQVYVETEGFRFSGFDKLFLKVFQFFHRTGNRAIRVGDKPMNSLCSVTGTGIGDSYFSRELLATLHFSSRKSNSAIFEFSVAQAVTERVQRVACYIFIESLMPASALTTVVIDRNLSR